MSQVTYPGFPRNGPRRELKQALESHWRGETSATALLDTTRMLRQRHWQLARNAGADAVPCNDFSLYDHVPDTAVAFDAIPDRFRALFDGDELTGYFAVARGYRRDGYDLHALEMTKCSTPTTTTSSPNFPPASASGRAATRHSSNCAKRVRSAMPPAPCCSDRCRSCCCRRPPTAAIACGCSMPSCPLTPRCRAGWPRPASTGCNWTNRARCRTSTPLRAKDSVTHTPRWPPRARHASCCQPTLGPLGDNLDLAARPPVQGLQVDLARAAGQFDAVLDALPR